MFWQPLFLCPVFRELIARAAMVKDAQTLWAIGFILAGVVLVLGAIVASCWDGRNRNGGGA